MKAYLLTTVDNPYHPSEEFDKWYTYDTQHGYGTSEYLARVAYTSRYLTDAENQRNINAAVDDILRLDDTGLYKRVIVDDSE